MPPADKREPAAGRAAVQALLRGLPSVDVVIGSLAGQRALAGMPRPRLAAAVRAALAAERRRLLDEGGPAADAGTLNRRVMARLTERGVFSLAAVINATGVVLHTNLGRALLSSLAQARLHEVAAAYSNLEMDLARKERGSRYAHVDGLLQRLSGAEAALVVNNCAAAVLLALETLARGKEVIVSRGELIEIGGEFRIPDIMRRSGAVLREVGTTNRTHLKDYASAIGPETGLILKVHTSNYRVVGFTAAVSSRELAELGQARGVPVMEDLGSGCFVDLTRYGFPYEPTVPEVVASGVDLVSFSGDKLLGGPQAGILVGRGALVERLAHNPLNRALRIDKFTVAALEATLFAYEAGTALETIPTLRMLTEPAASVRRRARRILGRLPAATQRDLGAQVIESRSQVGGGALPTVELPTAAIALGTPERPAERLDEALRAGRPAVLGRLLDDHLLLDCRTVLPSDAVALASRLESL
ncbi:MAG TPA: L-seryl-tRNA(Sec) selenium transferase [Candidatus Dormibacteraeota bacterium]|nr:L-seryl-tRNA(Sec) selenium transferase [Candidatus Dormibacteraeota bacterium]